ncbi:MAG: phosphoglycerate mutase [bacterium]|nr:phosphoglycerate mutase [bacterium]
MLEVIKDIVIENNTKLVLFVLDGLGDLPNPNYGNRTPLEMANKENILKLLKSSALGMAYPLSLGVTVGSGPGHTALFGFDPVKYQIKRGILEVIGMDMEVNLKSVAIRGNWAKVEKRNENFIVLDRRANRIPTSFNQELVLKIKPIIQDVEKKFDIKIDIKSGMEHRLGIVITPNNDILDVDVFSNDPQKDGLKVLNFSQSSKLGRILEEMNSKIFENLQDEKANYILFRGITSVPDLPNFRDTYKVKPLAIGQYPMYLGIAKLFDFDVIRVSNYDSIVDYFSDYDFIFIHYKYTDMAGEDGNFQMKVEHIEKADKIVGDIMKINPDVLVITGDHSTPCVYRSHGFQPTPYMLYSKNGDVFSINSDFTERECFRGELGIFPLLFNMQLMLAYSKRLQKFGA